MNEIMDYEKSATLDHWKQFKNCREAIISNGPKNYMDYIRPKQAEGMVYSKLKKVMKEGGADAVLAHLAKC